MPPAQQGFGARDDTGAQTNLRLIVENKLPRIGSRLKLMKQLLTAALPHHKATPSVVSTRF
jgi:hypothetical protein